jgi:hypothetical protein
MGWPERIIALTIGLTAYTLGSVVPVSWTHPFTCVVCRLGRVDLTYFGAADSTFGENECSRWYREHVDPKHAHVWEEVASFNGYNLFGGPVYRVSNCRRSVSIRSISSSTQLAFYQHVEDPKKAAQFFKSLTDGTTIDDHAVHDRKWLTMKAIEAWEAEGFPGAWEEWRSVYTSPHVPIHN